MKIVIAGGSGFIGQKLTEHLVEQGHNVVILSRYENEGTDSITYVQWLQNGAKPENKIKQADVFINLAGVSINTGRWTRQDQQQIYDSRMIATDELLRIFQQLSVKPSTLINASAIGIYPTSETAKYTESSNAVATDFLGTTVNDWESKAMTARNHGLRVACMRFGVILGKNGGALPPIVTPYKFFVGGTVGSGQQWLSWVHLEDVIRAIAFVIATPSLAGPINVTSPFPKRMKYFGKTIASTLQRPHWLPMPAFLMQMMLGKKSKLVLEGQYVTPEKLLAHHFTFSYPTLETALQNLLK